MRKKLILNIEEICLGSIFGASLVYFVGYLSAGIAAVLCGFLWSFGGSGAGRAWRYAGVPAVALTVLKLSGVSISWMDALISTVGAMCTLSIGYGIPSKNDEGSTLGKFIYHKIAKKDELVANLITRGTLASLLAFSYLFLVFTKFDAYVMMFVEILVLQLTAIYFVDGNIEL